MLYPVKAVVVCILLTITGTRADFSCVCNYAVEQDIYQDSDVASNVIANEMIFTRFQERAKLLRIGYMQEASTLQVQTCAGSPQVKDTVTTGPSTASTTPQSSTTTPAPTTTTTTTTTPTTTITTSTTTTSTVPTTRAPTTSSVPVSTPPPHLATTKMSRPSTTMSRLTTTMSRLTTQLPVTHAPTTQKPKLQTTPAPHVQVTQPHVQTTRTPYVKPTTKAPQPVAHVSTTYTCPRNVISAAMHNRGYTTVHGNICYELVPGQHSWKTAEANCNHKGGYLIHVASFDEETAIMRFLQSHRYDNEPFWTGLNDIGHEQQFTWTNGDPVTYTKWLNFHTNHFNHHTVEDCVVLVPWVKNGLFQSSGVWDDVYCNNAYPWVCQYDAVPQASQTHSSYTTINPLAQALVHGFWNLIGK